MEHRQQRTFPGQHVKRLSAILLCLLAPPLAAQTPDSSLARLLGHLLRSELRGGGWRDTVVWQPYDSASRDLLRGFNLGPSHTVGPIGNRTLDCPGSTDSSWTAFAQPVGYTVNASARFRTPDSAIVDLAVTCRFTFRGRGHYFAEAASWEVVKSVSGSWVARLLSKSIT